MHFNYQDQLPSDFSPHSRVWIYQSNRLFTLQEALHIEDLLKNFVAAWQSHGAGVKGYANLFFGQFIVVMADESAVTVGGCSTDSSVRMVKEIEKAFGVDLFNRQMLAFVIKEKVQLLPFQQLQYAADNQFIHADTLYFNNLVSTKQELETSWLVPVKDSWLAGKLHMPLNA